MHCHSRRIRAGCQAPIGYRELDPASSRVAETKTTVLTVAVAVNNRAVAALTIEDLNCPDGASFSHSTAIATVSMCCPPIVLFLLGAVVWQCHAARPGEASHLTTATIFSALAWNPAAAMRIHILTLSQPFCVHLLYDLMEVNRLDPCYGFLDNQRYHVRRSARDEKNRLLGFVGTAEFAH